MMNLKTIAASVLSVVWYLALAASMLAYMAGCNLPATHEMKMPFCLVFVGGIGIDLVITMLLYAVNDDDISEKNHEVREICKEDEDLCILNRRIESLFHHIVFDKKKAVEYQALGHSTAANDFLKLASLRKQRLAALKEMRENLI